MCSTVLKFYKIYQWNRSNTLLLWYLHIYSESCKKVGTRKVPTGPDYRGVKLDVITAS